MGGYFRIWERWILHKEVASAWWLLFWRCPHFIS